MQLTRHPDNPILTRNPDQPWEAGSALNPCVLDDDGVIRMVYRATNDVAPDQPGRYVSSIGYAESTDGVHFARRTQPLIAPSLDAEEGLGCEDPRITKVDGEYLIYYTAVRSTADDFRVRIALATSPDCVDITKRGVVGPATASKAACLFPERIGGQYVLLYTWMADSPLSSIVSVRFDSLDEVASPPAHKVGDALSNYEDTVVLRPPPGVHRGAEVGAVPIKTDAGWLLIYCGANTSNRPQWTIDAALLDLEDPRRILATTDEPLLAPETDIDRGGVVSNVTFPSGAIVRDGQLLVYYGSGDAECCLATGPLDELLDALH